MERKENYELLTAKINIYKINNNQMKKLYNFYYKTELTKQINET